MTVAALQFDPAQTPLRRSAVETQVGQSIGQLMRAVQDLVRQVPGAGALKVDRGWTDAVTTEPVPQHEVALRNAELILAVRKVREKIFGLDLFANPAWDILVELYVAASRGTRVTVGNACITAGLPVTSALRLCHQLQDRGFVLRERDPFDRRRVLLCLSENAHDALTQVLGTVPDAHACRI